MATEKKIRKALGRIHRSIHNLECAVHKAIMDGALEKPENYEDEIHHSINSVCDKVEELSAKPLLKAVRSSIRKEAWK